MVSGCDADEFPPRSIGEIRRVLHRTRAHIAPPALRSLAYAPFLIVPEWLQPDPLSITIGLVGWAVLEYALWRRRRQKR
jgi:hypothetical protein